MKLSKREKYMLAVLASVLFAAALFFVLVMATMNRISDKQLKLQELELQQQNMEMLLSNETLEENYENEAQKAEKNYDSFYSTLNSYTIDRILSDLMDANDIQVKDLKINPYTPVKNENKETEDEALEEDAKKKDNLLLVSQVHLSGSGTHENILAFLNAMNEKSVCLQVVALAASDSKEAEKTGVQEFSFDIQIYGIEEPEGVQGGLKAQPDNGRAGGEEENGAPPALPQTDEEALADGEPASQDGGESGAPPS